MSLKITQKQLWGMVHVGPLPGTPHFQNQFEKNIERAVLEAKTLESLGFTGILFENMHDVPYLNKKVGPEITAAMAVLGFEIKKATSLPLGIQILAGANHEALSVAEVVGAQWVRVEGFVFAHVGDEGIMEACAGELLRLRKALNAQEVKIMADIKKKHSSHAITQDVDLLSTAEAAQFFGADAVIITGPSTGKAASTQELKDLKKGLQIPVLIGSGITSQNLKEYREADGFIVGSALKIQGKWQNPIDPDASSQIVQSFQQL